MDFDHLNQSYYDLDGRIHLSDPLYYLSAYTNDLMTQAGASEIIKNSAESQQELALDIKDKYKQLAPKEMSNTLSTQKVDGGSRSQNIPQFRFNPLQRRNK